MPMMLHIPATIRDADGNFTKVIIRSAGYYGVKEKLKQDADVAKQAGPVKTYRVTPEEAARLCAR